MRTSDEANFLLISIFVGLLWGGWKLLQKVIQSLTTESFTGKAKKGGKGGSMKPFFVKSLTRRRRLDVTRKGDNILSGKMGKKMKSHRKGMFGK